MLLCERTLKQDKIVEESVYENHQKRDNRTSPI